MPWVTGFAVTAASDGTTSDHRGPPSSDDEYGAITLHADVIGDDARDSIVATLHSGLVIKGATGRILARAPGFPAEGSADDLVALAVGDGQLDGAPLVLLAVQRGGHRESTISVAVYRMTTGRTLDRLFMAPIELHDGDRTATGSLTFVPSGLVYRAPDAAFATPWTFDVGQHRYLDLAARGSN
jgi:hypothetical protein